MRARSSGPERRLVAADALADLDDHVLVVGRVGLDERQLQLDLEPLHVGLVLRRHLGELGVVPRRLQVGDGLAPLLRELVGALELLQAAADLLGLAAVVVDRRVGHPLLRLGVGALELLDEFGEIRHGRGSG